MRRRAAVLLACVWLFGTAGAPRDRAAELEPGLLLYATPGLPDPNFAKTVVLLLQHGKDGSLGLVLNRPTTKTVDAALDLKPGTTGVDLPVFWGGPVEPAAVMSLVRTFRPGPSARTILKEVQLTPDLADVKDVLGGRDSRLRARLFTGYAGWDRGQLAAEVRGGSWVLERADAATVFSPEPSRMWEKVHEILSRVQAHRGEATWPPGHTAPE